MMRMLRLFIILFTSVTDGGLVGGFSFGALRPVSPMEHGARAPAPQRRLSRVSLPPDAATDALQPAAASPARVGEPSQAALRCRSLANMSVELAAARVCDGIDDCLDRRDERGCSACHSHAWLCATGGQCIPALSRCDGLAHCPDASDEEPAMCRREGCPAGVQASFQCDDGVCLHVSELCDGDAQCADGSDEQLCCPPLHWQCPLNRSACIEQRRRCDGVPDCAGGEDERHCPHCRPPAFLCSQADSSYCISAQRRCDGWEDCDGAEDEMGCGFPGLDFASPARHVRQRQKHQPPPPLHEPESTVGEGKQLLPQEQQRSRAGVSTRNSGYMATTPLLIGLMAWFQSIDT